LPAACRSASSRLGSIAHLDRAGDADLAQPLRVGRQRLDVVQEQAGRDVLHQVEDVVHAVDQPVDLVAVERRDEGLVQQLHRLVRDLVRLLLAALDGAAARLELRQVGEQRLELERRRRRQRGVLVEEVEELRFPREQAHVHRR